MVHSIVCHSVAEFPCKLALGSMGLSKAQVLQSLDVDARCKV